MKDKLRAKVPSLRKISSGRELNHYFNLSGNLETVFDEVSPLIPKGKKSALQKIMKEGQKISIRTRQALGKTLFIIKASVGDDTSANGVSRIEFEAEVQKTLDELDKVLLGAGLTYQAKWSRDREEYENKDHRMHITIDRNAGYGYVAEFEKMANLSKDVQKIEKEIRDFMADLGIEELSQDRLERMFAHYNHHWRDYYGTDKVFNIK
ncbi:MAG: CYTH domain-containing protein [Parcubacteria group bacterium]